MGVGGVERGRVKEGMKMRVGKGEGRLVKCKMKEVDRLEGVGGKKVECVCCGEMCGMMGVEGLEMGDRMWELENGEGVGGMGMEEGRMRMVLRMKECGLLGKEGK